MLTASNVEDVVSAVLEASVAPGKVDELANNNAASVLEAAAITSN